jgi:hypothetical protein
MDIITTDIIILCMLGGLLFILIAIVGGGFSIKEITIPKVPKLMRVISFFVGVALIYISITLPPTPETGSISVSSIPSGASIYLDGNYRGTTPKTIEKVEPGSYVITLKLSGYQDWFQTISIEAGEKTPITQTLTLTTIPEHTQTMTPIPYTPFPINNPPEAFIDSINPSPALQGQSVTFTSHGEDPDGEDYITEYRWESNIDGFLSDQKSFSTSSLTSGSHKIILRVKDSNEQWSNEVTRDLKVKIYLNEDFENGMPVNWWVWIDPKQKDSAFYDVILEPGTKNHILRGFGHVNMGPEDIGQEWEDYSLQVRIMLVKGRAHLNMRHFFENDENNWRYFIVTDQNGVSICKTVNSNHNCITGGDKYLGYNTWHLVKIITKANQIKIYVDGDLITEYIDVNPLKQGSITLETLEENAEVYYDDVLVEEID